MIAFMEKLDKDLTDSGELVFQQGLTDGSTAKTVGLEQGVPVATDGPFAEAKEFPACPEETRTRTMDALSLSEATARLSELIQRDILADLANRSQASA